MQQKCVFLDRDGVLNRERGEYTYRLDDFEVLPDVIEALALLKENGYLLIVVTNQAGIAKGLYQKQDVMDCHAKLQEACNYMVDAIYFAPGHPKYSESLSRKPDSLMLEKAIAKFNIDPSQSWMVGDSVRDLEAAERVGIRAILVGPKYEKGTYTYQTENLLEAAHLLLQSNR